MLQKFETADDSVTYITRIIDKVQASKKYTPKVHIAYAISVCKFLLNLSNQKVQVSEVSINTGQNNPNRLQIGCPILV